MMSAGVLVGHNEGNSDKNQRYADDCPCAKMFVEEEDTEHYCSQRLKRPQY